MEIARSGDTAAPRFALSGRLDSHWADHLTQGLDEAIRDGAQGIEMDLGGVEFISSGGIRVLLSFQHQLSDIGGRLAVRDASPAVRRVIEMVGLEELLASGAAVPESETGPESGRVTEADGVRLEVFDLRPDAVLSCRPLGDPERLTTDRYGAADCASVEVPEASFAVGLGAFGDSFDDCRTRFGEFLAAGGAAAYLPTDGANTPDYLVSAGTLVPRLQVLYGLVASGQCARLVRFQAARGEGAVSLVALARACLDSAGAPAVGMVMVAESAGLVGASLRRSPAADVEAGDVFGFPGVRDWLSFTPERAFTRRQVVAVGIASREEASSPLAPWLRPLASDLQGHFHAAAFSHRPLARGAIELGSTIRRFFESERLLGVLHLLEDDREEGAGQSRFVRGACWYGPVVAEPAAEPA